MERHELGRILSGYSLPPLSAVAVQLLELASAEEASVEQIVRLIEKDPALTVRLLNLANSAAFGAGRPAGTLSHAVMRLGSNNVKLMALSISLRGAFPMGMVEQFDYEMFWRVSLYRALIARALAHRSGVADPEEAFLSGITLEIGLPILFDLFIKGRSDFRIKMEPLGKLLKAEKDVYGINHRQLGAAALSQWRFPDHIIACQLVSGDAAYQPNASVLATLCDLARLFSKVFFDLPGAFHYFYAKAAKILRLCQDDIHEIVLETFAEVDSIAKSFKLEIDKGKDLMEVMERANHALARISQQISQLPAYEPPEELPSFDSIDHKSKLVSDTLQAVAHEIRNPLTAVGGFARRLAESLDPCSKQGKYARIILDEALRLEKVLSTMPNE